MRLSDLKRCNRWLIELKFANLWTRSTVGRCFLLKDLWIESICLKNMHSDACKLQSLTLGRLVDNAKGIWFFADETTSYRTSILHSQFPIFYLFIYLSYFFLDFGCIYWKMKGFGILVIPWYHGIVFGTETDKSHNVTAPSHDVTAPSHDVMAFLQHVRKKFFQMIEFEKWWSDVHYLSQNAIFRVM